jgi:hypothetical protein
MLLSCNRPKRGLLKASMEFLHLRNVVTKLFSQFRSGLDDIGLGEQPNHLATDQKVVCSNHAGCKCLMRKKLQCENLMDTGFSEEGGLSHF